MTWREVLDRARKILTHNKIQDADIEAEIILRYTLNINRASLLADTDTTLTKEQEADFWNKIERRIKGVPSAYIIGVREFFGLEFHVDESVLIPRSETELLVEKAIELVSNYEAPTIADIGTGCGNVAISLAVNLPRAKIYATDISPQALDTARRNCERHCVDKQIRLFWGDLLEPLPESVDVIVSNLPYVITADLASVNTGGYEPRQALDGGEDGLDVIRRLCDQVDSKLKSGGYLLLEIGLGQKNLLVNYLGRLFPGAKIESFQDLAGTHRVVCLKRR